MITIQVGDEIIETKARLDALLHRLNLKTIYEECYDPGCHEGSYQDGEVCPTCGGLSKIFEAVER